MIYINYLIEKFLNLIRFKITSIIGARMLLGRCPNLGCVAHILLGRCTNLRWGHQIIGALPQSPLCQAFSLTGEDGTWSFYCQPEGLTQQSDGQRPSELANHTTTRWATSIGIEN